MCSECPEVLARRRSQSELFIIIIMKCQGPLSVFMSVLDCQET